MRPNSKLMLAALGAALGGLVYGFDTVVISGIIDAVVRLYGLGGSGMGLTVAIAPIGTVVGCFAAGAIGQRMGSRQAMRWTAALYILSAVGSALALAWPTLLATRFLSGAAIGAASVLAPVYIAELAPAMWRGRLVGSFQINVVLGILLGYTSSYLVRLAHMGAAEWRVMVGVAAVPAILFMVALFRLPLSPRWLVSRRQTDEALAVLDQMGAADPRAELAEMQAAIDSEHAVAHEPVFRWKYRYPLFLAITIGAFNQLAGVNAILYYMSDIFKAAGFSQISGDLQAMVIGVANLLFTLLGMTLIDRFGRKSLLLVGAPGMAACLAGVAWIFSTQSHQAALLGLLVTYVAFFAVSQGVVIWVFIGEVFPTSVRSKGQGVGAASLMFTSTMLAFFFPVLKNHFGAGTPFAFFAVATALQFIVVALFYPETKGLSLEQLQRKLVKD